MNKEQFLDYLCNNAIHEIKDIYDYNDSELAEIKSLLIQHIILLSKSPKNLKNISLNFSKTLSM